jgi:hypothetical protein
MAKEEGLTRSVFTRALESLTGQKHGPFPDIWAKWWAAHGESILASGLPPEEGVGDPTAQGEGGTFYGIPQISQRIIYVLDTSGSMKHEVGQGTRLDACRTEFKRALRALRPGATFNVVIYSKDARRFAKKPMVPAGDDSRSAAEKFVDEFAPAQNTNIFDALRTAFEMCGEGATKKGSPLNADTIYLLTDGSPTMPDGKPDDTNRILDAVREWNAARVVTIHTIGVGDALNTGFLSQLASENNGQFIHKKGE